MIPWSKLLRSPIAISVLVSTLVVICVLGLRRAGSLESMELAAYDWCIRLRPEVTAQNSRIVLITITESDIGYLGSWPLSDSTMAQALAAIIQGRPRAIGLDIYRDVPVPPGHEELKVIFTSNPQIMTVTKFGEDGVPPPPVLKGTDQVGFNDIVIDPGGIVRRGLLFLDDGETVYYSFALRLVLLYLQQEGIFPQPDTSNPTYLRLGPTTIRPLQSNEGGYVNADTRGYQFLLDFKDSRESFSSFSLKALLAGEIDPGMFKDKIVLVGVTAASVKDYFFTPDSRGLEADQQVSGITLHARIVSQLLRFGLGESSLTETVSEWQEVMWILVWGVLGGTMGLRVHGPWRFSILGASGFLLLGLVTYLAFLNGWWVPVVPPALTWLLSAAIVTAYMSSLEKRQRAVLMRLFSSHVSPEIADVIWRQREEILEAGRPRPQKLIATILFTDLEGYTSVSEKMDPQALIDWLNGYMETMTQVVMAHGGVVDDYAGDGVKANFGVPLPRTTEAEIRQDAVNAVKCALAMEGGVRRLNKNLQERDLPIVGLRIGIFTGPVVAGSVGSKERLKYTTVGDTVNIAARLESFGKELVAISTASSSCRIVIGEATFNYLDHQFKAERVGELSLKGKDKKIAAYSVLGLGEKNTNPINWEKKP